MKIGVLSDAHGNMAGLDACLIAMGPVDRLFFLGDALGYYFAGAAVLRRLRSLGAVCLAGNHDLYFLAHQGRSLSVPISVPSPAAYCAKYGPAMEFAASQLTAEEIDWLAALPCERSIEVAGTSVRMVHGSPWRPADGYVYPDSKELDRFDEVEESIVLMGHTHRGFLRRGSPTLLNPGSCGQPRDGDARAAYATIEIEGAQASCVLHRAAYARDSLLAQCRAIAPDVPLLTTLLTRESGEAAS